MSIFEEAFSIGLEGFWQRELARRATAGGEGRTISSRALSRKDTRASSDEGLHRL